MLRTACLAVLLSAFVFSNAQNSIKGTVSDEQGNSLPGANILLPGTTFGTVTNETGDFLIQQVPPGDYSLTVSYLGYEPKEFDMKLLSDTILNISLVQAVIWGEDIIVKATRADANTPTSYTEVDEEEIGKKNLGQDIPFLLAMEPNLVTTSDAGAGVGYTGMWIRGSDIQHINVTVNGIPLNDPESHGVFWVNMPDFASSVQSIQVQRGVGTSTNGGGAFGANLNLETENLEREAYAELNNSYGSFNTLKNTFELGTGLIKDHFVFNGRVSSIQSDGYVDRASSDLKSYFLQGGFYSEKTILKAIVFGGKEKTYQSWNGIDSATLATNPTYNSCGAIYDENWNVLGFYDNETDNYQQDHYQLHFTQLLTANLKFNGAIHYSYGRGYYEQYKAGEYLDDYPIGVQYFGYDSVLSGTDYDYFYHDSVEYGDLIVRRWLDNHFYGATYALHYSGNSFEATLGGASNKYANAKHYGEIIWSEFSGDTDIRDTYYNNVSDKTDNNVYAKVNYNPVKNLGIYVDLQMRFVSYTAEGTDSDGSEIDIDESWDFFNPKIGITYHFESLGTFYASYAKAHREPIRTDFIDAPEGTTPKPEDLNDIEAGLRGGNEKYFYQLNGYYMLYKNQLVLTGEINDVGTAIRSNAGESYRLGVEMNGGMQINKFVQVAANLALSENKTDYTTYDGTEFVEYKNTPISFSPSVVSGFQIGITPIKRLELMLNGKYVSRQYLDLTGSESKSLDPYFKNDLLITYNIEPKFIKSIVLSFQVNNLFDVDYVTNGYLWGDTPYYYPQAGINFMGGLSLRF